MIQKLRDTMDLQKFDAVIIGSGLGGLTCGATLAKAGKKVLVLEQHDLIGGCATCFKRKGMLVDAGLHELDWGSTKTDMKHIIFKEIGLLDKVKFVPLPTAWSIIESDDKANPITIPHSSTQPNATKYALIKLFPQEKKGIEKYFKKIAFQAYLNRKFPFMMGFLEFFFAPLTTLIFLTISAIKNRNVGDMLDSMIQDSKLKRILNINLAYYHNNPYKFDWNYHAIAQTNYYHQGMYVKGGSQSLSDGLAKIITENGGEVKIHADVTRILLDKNDNTKAVGVLYQDKKSKEEHTIHADKIIANCDPYIVYNKLLSILPQSAYEVDSKLTQNFEIETSLLSVYMIFDTDLSKKFPDMDYSTFFVDSKEFNKPFNRQNAKQLDIPITQRDFVFVNYSKIDSGLSQREDRFLGVITTVSSYAEWDNLDKELYKTKKQEVKEAFERRLEEFFPGIMESCIHSELATPKTIERYTRTRKGTPYGYDQNQEGFFGRERFKSKSIKNLYFASVFGFPGSGFTGAILAGYRTAKKILDPYFYPRRLSLCVLFGVTISIVLIEILSLL